MGILYRFWMFTFCFLAISFQLIDSAELRGRDNAIYTFDETKLGIECDILGFGCYALVLRGTKKNGENEIDVALKFADLINASETSVLHEAKIYQIVQGHKSIPKFYDFLKYNEHDVLIVDLLGKTLNDLNNSRGGFSLKTIMMIGLQMLDIIEYIHNKGLVHNDITLNNMAVGFNNMSNIYLFDFGSANFYMENDVHIKEGEKRPPHWLNTYYFSTYGERVALLSRRMDIKMLAYILITLIEGLEVSEIIRASQNSKHMSEKEIQEVLMIEYTEITLSRFLVHATSLGFEDTPNYKLLKDLLRNQLKKDGETNDLKYDWTNHCWQSGCCFIS